MHSLFFNHFLFCVSGVGMVIIIQWMDLAIPEITLGVPAFFTYFGYTLAWPSLYSSQVKFNKLFLAVFLLDALASGLCQISIFLAGGQIFTAVFASIVLWAAIIKRIYLGTRLNRTGYLSIGLIFMGLVLTAGDAEHYGNLVELGILAGVLGSMVYAAQYVCSEVLVHKHNVNPYTVTAFNGLMGWGVCAVYLLVYTIPHWSVSIDDYSQFALLGAGLSLATLTHSVTFYTVSGGKNTPNSNAYGAIVISVNKALQTVLTFISNDLLFCKEDPVECIDTFKIIAIISVFVGIVLYAYSSTDKQDTSIILLDAPESEPLLIEVDENGIDSDDPEE